MSLDRTLWSVIGFVKSMSGFYLYDLSYFY